MASNERSVWLVAGVRTPFVHVDGPLAHRDSLALSVPVVQAMAQQARGPIDFAVWGPVVLNLAYNNLAREVWIEAGLDPHVPTFTTIMQCSTSMVGVFRRRTATRSHPTQTAPWLPRRVGSRKQALGPSEGHGQRPRGSISLWLDLRCVIPAFASLLHRGPRGSSGPNKLDHWFTKGVR